MDCAHTQAGDRKAASVRETPNPDAHTWVKRFSGTAALQEFTSAILSMCSKSKASGSPLSTRDKIWDSWWRYHFLWSSSHRRRQHWNSPAQHTCQAGNGAVPTQVKPPCLRTQQDSTQPSLNYQDVAKRILTVFHQTNLHYCCLDCLHYFPMQNRLEGLSIYYEIFSSWCRNPFQYLE